MNTARAVGHADNDALSQTASGVEIRPRYVRTSTPERAISIERERLLSAFRRLLAPHGTAAAVAEAWGVSEQLVSLVKAGERPLTDKKLAALPPALLLRFRRLVESREPEQLSFQF